MNVPAWHLPGGGKRRPKVIEQATAAILNAGRESKLYARLCRTLLPNKQQRKAPVRSHKFAGWKRDIAALLSFTNLANMCAGKRDNGDVIGVSRKALLGVDRFDRRFQALTRRFSRNYLTAHDAGYADRQRRGGKATLFMVARQVLADLGLLDQLLADKAHKQAERLACAGLLTDASTDVAHHQSSQGRAGNAGDAVRIGAYLSGAPPPKPA